MPIPRSPIELIAVERDPQGNIDRYAAGCEDILRNSGARHIIGCVTSWSRKEVIPVLEKAGGTLWYACPYEGFEANEHVVYMHACPNQHLVPLLGYVVPRFGRQRLPARLELHLGLGDQPRRARPDRRCRRQGAWASATCRSARPTFRG